jgi:hypothetical protein
VRNRSSSRSAGAEARSAAKRGFERVLLDKYYVDEIYDDAIVKPVYRLSRGFAVARSRCGAGSTGSAVNGQRVA